MRGTFSAEFGFFFLVFSPKKFFKKITHRGCIADISYYNKGMKSKRQGDCKRRRRLEGEAKKLEWYAYWRTVRHSRRLLGDAAPKALPFK